MSRSVGRDIDGHDILGKVAVSGGEVPAILADDALDGRGLPELLDARRSARIPVVAGLVLEGDLHHPLRATYGNGLISTA